jgi:outer membrane protein assembly factor BamB
MKKFFSLTLAFLFCSPLFTAEPGSIKWQFDVQGAVNSAPTPSPDGSTIYVGSESNHLWALNANGTRKWAYPFLFPVYASPAVSKDASMIYVSVPDLANRRGTLYAITNQGELRWQFSNGRPFGTPKVDRAGTIFFDVIWIGTLPTTNQAFWSQCPAKIDPDGRNYSGMVPYTTRVAGFPPRLIIDRIQCQIHQEGSPLLNPLVTWELAPDDKEGAITLARPRYSGGPETLPLQWNFRTNQFFRFDTFRQALSFPAIDTTRDIFYFGGVDGILYAYRNTARSALWRRVIGADISKGAPVVGDDGRIYVGAADGNLYAVYPDATFKWVAHVSDVGIDKRPAVDNRNGIVYVVDQPGNVIAVDTDTGKVLWKQMDVDATPASVGPDGTVYVGTADHTVIAFNGGK